ncbi:hypothetical protein HDU98_004925 [Podochytrium sp. JEL0797]|nr:hypothetical protein HDU98_004925 [Podochytrium sp. JEL0797]
MSLSSDCLALFISFPQLFPVNNDACCFSDAGVVCSGNRVVALLLSNQNLFGPFPPQVAALQQLQKIDLSGNLLNGTVPTELGLLTQLTSIYKI